MGVNEKEAPKRSREARGAEWSWGKEAAQGSSWEKRAEWSKPGWESEWATKGQKKPKPDREKPVAWDVMCGPNYPVAKALRWCGWEVEVFDTLISPDHDLLKKELRNRLLEEVDNVDALFAANDCSTFARARDRPIPGHPNAPAPLRSQERPMGIPGLDRSNDQRVESANSLLKFVARLFDFVMQNGGATALENPENSWIWVCLQILEEYCTDNLWNSVFAGCACGGARRKMGKLRHNVEELRIVESKCQHTHEPDEWKVRQIEGTWYYPTREEAEYPAELAWMIAIGLSWWVVRTNRVKLQLPVLISPVPEEEGDRKDYLKWNHEVLRLHAMQMVGFRCGIASKTLWGLNTPMRVNADDLGEWTADCIYIGRGGNKWGSVKSPWCTSFVPGVDGSPEECVRKFADLISSDMEWRKWICKLQNKWLVCECSAGDACHGDALVMEYVAQFSPGAVAAKRKEYLEETVPPKGSVAGLMTEGPSRASGSDNATREKPAAEEEQSQNTGRRFSVVGFSKSWEKGKKGSKGAGKGKAKTTPTFQLGRTAKSFATGGKGRGWDQLLTYFPIECYVFRYLSVPVVFSPLLSCGFVPISYLCDKMMKVGGISPFVMRIPKVPGVMLRNWYGMTVQAVVTGYEVLL